MIRQSSSFWGFNTASNRCLSGITVHLELPQHNHLQIQSDAENLTKEKPLANKEHPVLNKEKAFLNQENSNLNKEQGCLNEEIINLNKKK